jgi:hypothetical protein
MPACRTSANSAVTNRSKALAYSMTSSARASSAAGISAVAQSMGVKPQQLTEIMITAQALAQQLGIPVEMALQVIMQSATQPQGGDMPKKLPKPAKIDHEA